MDRKHTVQALISAYNDYYKERQIPEVYPVEFVVRTFLGHYKNLKLDKSKFAASRILDLGYGDGRNMPLLHNLQFKIFGVEISNEINKIVRNRLQKLAIPAELRSGHNTNIPFPSLFFQYVLACHSCYYISEGETFYDNLKEINRVLSSNGIFICSLPHCDSYILEGADILPNGHYRIKKDPYKLRNNIIFRAFSNEEEIKEAFNDYFLDLRIGFCDDNFYGIHQRVWIVTCWKKS